MGRSTVEKRGCFAVPEFPVSDEQVDPIACFDATEDSPHKAVVVGLVLALPLHAGR